MTVIEADKSEMEKMFPLEDFDRFEEYNEDEILEEYIEKEQKALEKHLKDETELAIKEVIAAFQDGYYGILKEARYKYYYLPLIEEQCGKDVVEELFKYSMDRDDFYDYDLWKQDCDNTWFDSPFRHYSYRYAWNHRGDGHPKFSLGEKTPEELAAADRQDALESMTEDERKIFLKKEKDELEEKRKNIIREAKKLGLTVSENGKLL